jgi:hypothetical protein
MKFLVYGALSFLTLNGLSSAFIQGWTGRTVADHRVTKLHVSIGIGPDKKGDEEKEVKELVPGVDYEVPDHESFRTSRRSAADEQCDKWFENLMGEGTGSLGLLAEEAKRILTTPVPLINEVRIAAQPCMFTLYVTNKSRAISDVTRRFFPAMTKNGLHTFPQSFRGHL